MTTTATVAGVIRAGIEHDALEPLLREAERMAIHLGGTPGPGSLRRIDAVVEALVTDLFAHMDAEEANVYPVVFTEELRPAVDLLVLDHEAIRGAVARLRSSMELAQATGYVHNEPLRRTLIAVVTLVRAHHAKEGFLYVRAMIAADVDEEVEPD